MREVLVTQWVQPAGFDLAVVTLNSQELKISVNLVFGELKEFKKFIASAYDHKVDVEDANALATTFTHEGKAWNYLLITKNDWHAEDYGTIAHELHHITHFALEEKGITYGSAGEECFAYVQGYFMELVVRAFMELKKSKWSKLQDKKKLKS